MLLGEIGSVGNRGLGFVGSGTVRRINGREGWMAVRVWESKRDYGTSLEKVRDRVRERESGIQELRDSFFKFIPNL